MAKEVKSLALRIIAICIAYILQLYIFNNINFYGVKANLPIIILAVISIFSYNKKEMYIYGVICGILNDLLIGSIVGKYLVINIFVVTILTSIKGIYKQDSKFSVIIFTATAIMVFEVVLLVFNIFIKKEIISIFIVIWKVFKECIINIFFAYIIYLIWTRLIEKEK